MRVYPAHHRRRRRRISSPASSVLFLQSINVVCLLRITNENETLNPRQFDMKFVDTVFSRGGTSS